MKSLKKESRLKIPASKFLEAAENLKEKKRTKVPEQPTPPIQEESEPLSNILQGDDILALAIKREDLKKQHIPRSVETGDKSVITQKFVIRKLKPKDPRRKICRLVAHPATADAATKPLDYSGLGDSYRGDQILPHHILGSLQDFRRIAVVQGNLQLAKQICVPPCLMTPASDPEEPAAEQKAPEEEKAHPRAPAPQHNFMKNWRRNLALWKRQQEALGDRLKKPVGELLMHSGETYRRVQEERELIDRVLPTLQDGKCSQETSGFWGRLEYLGDEMTGLLMTKTKRQRGLLEPITHVRKPHSIQKEMGLPAQKDARYRYTWDRSLFLIHRRKELRAVMAELDFSQQEIDGLEVVGRGQPFSAVTVEDTPVLGRSPQNSSEDTINLDLLVDRAPVPILGPSLLFCGKPACWIRGGNAQDKKQVGIAVRLTFETLEGQKASSELAVVNNGTVAIWYDWRRRAQPDSFQDLKRNRTQRFYFNNREGVVLPGETKTFTFFFKSLNAGIFVEFWEFGTHPSLLGGAALQVTLRAVALAQDLYKEARKSLRKELASQEAVTVVQSVLQELLEGTLSPERAQSPVDTYLTEEDLFHYRNPRLHYQHPVVQSLHRLWQQYLTPPPQAEEARLGEEQLGPRARAAHFEKAPVNVESSTHFRTPDLDSQLPQQENTPLKDSQDSVRPPKTRGGARGSQHKSIMEEILAEGSPSELEGLPLPEWNLCLEDFRKAAMTLPEENHREDALIRLNRAALELCQGQRPLQSDFLYQMCLQLWRDVIDSLVSHSLWLRALLGLPEKETVYLHAQEELDRKSPFVMEAKASSGRPGKEDRRGAAQEKKQLGIKDREDKKGAKLPLKEDRLNSKKARVKDDKKPVKVSSRDGLSLEDPAPDSATPSQEPIDPLVMEKYTERLHTEVYGLLDTLVTHLMALADELNPVKDVGDPLRLCL